MTLHPSTVKAVVNRLHDAAAILSRRGAWVQGEWAITKDGKNLKMEEVLAQGPSCGTKFCADGALRAAFYDRPDLYPYAIHAAAGAIGAVPYVTTTSAMDDFTEWNDHPVRQKRDVIRAFRRAARNFQKQHSAG